MKRIRSILPDVTPAQAGVAPAFAVHQRRYRSPPAVVMPLRSAVRRCPLGGRPSWRCQTRRESRAEANRQVGDALDRQLPIGEQFASSRDTQPLLIANYTDGGVFGKEPCKVAGAGVRQPSQFFKRPAASRIRSNGVLRAMDCRFSSTFAAGAATRWASENVMIVLSPRPADESRTD